MIKLIKNLKQVQNQEMQKGCSYDTCSIIDSSSCTNLDWCSIDNSACDAYEDECGYDSASGCTVADSCYYTDSWHCSGEYDIEWNQY